MEALDAARALLPAWVPWLPLLLWVPAAILVPWLVGGLAAAIALGSWRKLAPDAHWTERARAAHPARGALLLATYLATGTLAALAAMAGGPFAALPPAAVGAAVVAAAYATGAVLRARLHRRTRGAPMRGPTVARDDLVLVLLMAPHLLLVAALMATLRAPFNPFDAAALGLGMALAVFALRGAHLRALAAVGLAGPASPELEAAVRRAAERGGLPQPGLWTVRTTMANAFAFPLGHRLAFTTGAVEALGAEELRAVAAHELGHLAEPWPVRALRTAAVLALLPFSLVLLVAEAHGLPGVVALAVASLALTVVLSFLSQRLEARADAHALAHAEGAEPTPGGEETAAAAVEDAPAAGAGAPGASYARALEHLYRANAMPAVLGSRRPSHPHLYDRLVAAGTPPAYPRPAPPPRLPATLGLLAAGTVLVLLTTVLAGLPVLLRPAATESLAATSWRIGLADGADPLLRRALLHTHRGEPEPALVFARAAQAVEPASPTTAAGLALVLGGMGRCAEAHAQAERAEALAGEGDPRAQVWVANAYLSARDCRSVTAQR